MLWIEGFRVFGVLETFCIMQFCIKKFFYIGIGENKESTRKIMTVTNVGIANMPYWGVLPMGMTNYGGDTQIFEVPDYVNSRINMTLNPMAAGQLNQYLASAPNFAVQPANIDQNAANDLAGQWLAPVMGGLAENNVGSISSTIESTKAKLNSKLQTEGISDTDREKVNKLLERLDEQERKLKELQEAEGLSNDEIYEKTKEIEKELRKIVGDTAQLNITPKKAEKSEEPSGVKDEAQGVDSEDKVDGTPQNNQNTDTTNTDKNEKIDLDKMADDPQARLMAQMFRDAVNWTGFLGIAGTDNEKFNQVCEAITPENVVSVLLAYNKFHSSEDGESFMEAFMYDADGTQKPEYGRRIANALREVTIQLGIYDECDADFTEIYDELGDFSIDNTIYKCYDRILERICEASGGSKYAVRQGDRAKQQAKPQAANQENEERMSGLEVIARTANPIWAMYDVATGGVEKAWNNQCRAYKSIFGI